MTQARHAVLIVASFLVLSATSAANVRPTAIRHAVVPRDGGWMAKDANPKHTWIYVAGSSGNVIDIYDLDKVGTPQIGKITQGLNNPAMMAFDASGTMYVPNYNWGNDGGDVVIFPPGATSPSLTLSQGLSEPISVAVDAGGNVYVSNRGVTPSIVVFPPGSSTPSATITSSLLALPANLVFDVSENLHIADQDNGVLELPYGSSQPILLGLQDVPQPVGLSIDPGTGNLFVSTHPGNVRVFAPGTVTPRRTLRTTVVACVLANGIVRGKEYIFVPDCFNNNVYLFKPNRDKPVTTYAFSGAGSACCIGIKPPGMP